MPKRKICIILLVLSILSVINLPQLHIAKADYTDSATLRILATGDLHGQITAFDCESNTTLSTKGLSKIATIIKQKRAEAGVNNTLLLDAGDFLYDYTTNYFYDNYSDLTQPIMKAMSALGYDYITLGNHEFDYPWAYLNSQLDASGLLNKTLVCNTIWHDSGKQVFSPSAILTKTLTTENNFTKTIKIGIIGSTTNSISTRRGDYVNEIDTTNNYDSIVAEANRLKSVEQVDLVIVVLHGGIGTKTTSKSSDNIGYALTQVNSIDALVTAHTHDVFPDPNNDATTISNANTDTGCINGKPVLATSSYAGALGTIDLKLKLASDGSVTLASGTAGITYVTEDVKEDSTICSLFSEYLGRLSAGADKRTYKIAKGITYHNYDTVLQDSNLYQLLNNAKIYYGLTYISEYLPEYKEVPVIACTRNLLDSNEAYLLIKDSISASKISQVLSESSSSRPSGYIQMHEITGKNLREWLEYNASIYATQGTNLKTILKKYVSGNKDVSTLLQENYIYNWNNQYLFDGISYTIDLSKQPRYNFDGTLVSTKNKRISNLTYNGISVKDTQKFILVTDSGIPSLSFLPSDNNDTVKKVRDYATGKSITLDYIRSLNSFGNIAITADHNWSLTASKNYTFLLGIPKKIAGTVAKYSWNSGLAAETTSYSFYKGSLSTSLQSISLIAAQGRTEVNNQPVSITISATSKYTIKEKKYLSGKIEKTSDAKWNHAFIIKNSSFTATKNGVYTILATDTKGNSALTYIKVDLFDADTLESPKLYKLTNRNNVLTGTAIPNTTLHVTIGSDSYTTKVSAAGTFSLDIKPPKAFASICAYVESSGKKSTTTTASVRKTGPNAVALNSINVGDTYVNGTATTDTFLYALIWNTVYVGKGQTKMYMTSDYYKPTYKIVETDIELNQTTGAFTIALPALKTNMNVFVFSVDRFGVTSKSTMLSPVY